MKKIRMNTWRSNCLVTLLLPLAPVLLLAGCCKEDCPSLLPDCNCKDSVVTDTVRLYGVRWSTDNPYDLGERCFDAAGLTAHFGVGSHEGHSDFDSIYPWSEIRRCNVRNENGQAIVTYEGEPGFSLDGSNGDVFVRIPKFCVEKYQKDGYEYRVVSKSGQAGQGLQAATNRRVHPAFVEDGQELDAIYVGAFEASMDSDSLLLSVGGVIPASNIKAQQFLDAARQRGADYTLYDMRTVDMLFTLFAVEYGCRNTGTVFGYGIADYHQPCEYPWDEKHFYYSRKNERQTNSITCHTEFLPRRMTVGTAICICKGNQQDILTFAHLTDIEVHDTISVYTFDGPPIDITTDCFLGNCAQQTNWTETCTAPYHGHSGRANMVEAGFQPCERNPMRYRWVENVVGNLWHYLPDVTLYNRQLYVCSNMDDYCFGTHDGAYVAYSEQLTVNNDNGTLDDVSQRNCWITALIPDPELKGISLGCAYDRSLTSGAAFGAYYYIGNGLSIMVNGGGFDHRNRCNMLTTRAWSGTEYKWHLYGARLLYKPRPLPTSPRGR